MRAGVGKYSMHVYNYFFYIAYASFMPYLSVWFVEDGLSPQEIGLLYSIGPFVGFLFQPLWGMLIDYYGVGKLILLCSTLLTPWIALAYTLTDTFFPLYMAVSVALAVCTSALLPIIDAMTVRHAKKNALSYGGIRVTGSVSFGISVALFGILYDRWGISQIFGVYTISMLVLFGLTFFITGEQKLDTGARSGMLKEMVPLLKERRFILFLIPVFFAAIGPQMNNAFYSVYISHFGGEASGKIGILYTVATLTEIPFFLVSGWVVKKLGYTKALTYIALAGAVRWLVLSVEPGFEILLLNQLLSGLTYALFLSTGINYAYDMSPESTKTTAHSFFIVVYTNVAGIFASNLGGWMIEAGGYALLFQTAAVCSVVGAAGFVGLGRWSEKSSVVKKPESAM